MPSSSVKLYNGYLISTFVYFLSQTALFCLLQHLLVTTNRKNQDKGKEKRLEHHLTLTMHVNVR